MQNTAWEFLRQLLTSEVISTLRLRRGRQRERGRSGRCKASAAAGGSAKSLRDDRSKINLSPFGASTLDNLVSKAFDKGYDCTPFRLGDRERRKRCVQECL